MCFSNCVCSYSLFLSASWLGVTLSLSTSLPAPLDPVAISNQLRGVASPLLQPIAFTSLCDCVHACEWAGVLSHLCVGVYEHSDVLIWLIDWGHLCWLLEQMQPHCSSFIPFLFIRQDKCTGMAFYLYSNRRKQRLFTLHRLLGKLHTRRKWSA